MDLLAARKERIEMVKGLKPNQGDESGGSKHQEKKPLPQPEELDSTMTH
jgi:hypothetical protein